MYSGEDSAERSLFRSRREVFERTFCARHDFGSDVKVEAMTPEKGIQHSSPGGADYRVGSRIGRVRRGLPNLWKPVRIGQSRGVLGRIGSANSSHRTPEVIHIFGIVEGNYAIGKRQIKRGKKARVLGGCQVTILGSRLGNLIPVVLNSAVPKASGERLVCGSGSAVYHPECFYFIENVGIPVAA